MVVMMMWILMGFGWEWMLMGWWIRVMRKRGWWTVVVVVVVVGRSRVWV